jgi:5,10-methylenetetrahydromethanopterin reductase
MPITPKTGSLFHADSHALPAEALEAVAGVPYAAGVAPYLPLLPLITDRHIDALTADLPDN